MENKLTNAKLITCILPKGCAHGLQQALIEEKENHSVNFHFARGVGRFSRISARGIGEQQEKEVLEVVVSEEFADELFEFMFFKGEMDQPHGGVIYMTSIPSATEMQMPELPLDDKKAGQSG
ncbi:MAG: hypothetical protein CMQ20_12440 [Gammaproteobacteria bacterium]|jgi:nitrogen regulatory protein PII|nr:hypothetical protein [Gammaproteobacteria bacterium]|tara:strand:+ start:22019 stop:22384 length:366 start_codon:yes stop_codon:yes gene_type:complete